MWRLFLIVPIHSVRYGLADPGLCKCHTHKYDPIPHTDYFRLFAFFNEADECVSPFQFQPTTNRPCLPSLFRWNNRFKSAIAKSLTTKTLGTEQREIVEKVPTRRSRWNPQIGARSEQQERISLRTTGRWFSRVMLPSDDKRRTTKPSPKNNVVAKAMRFPMPMFIPSSSIACPKDSLVSDWRRCRTNRFPRKDRHLPRLEFCDLTIDDGNHRRPGPNGKTIGIAESGS